MFRASSVPIIRSYLLYTRQLARFMQDNICVHRESSRKEVIKLNQMGLFFAYKFTILRNGGKM